MAGKRFNFYKVPVVNSLLKILTKMKDPGLDPKIIRQVQFRSFIATYILNIKFGMFLNKGQRFTEQTELQ
jgi:hypothetical protein